MKNVRSFLVCLLSLSFTISAHAMPLIDVESGDVQTSDYYIQQAEAKKYRVEIREGIRSIFIQSTLNCLNDMINERNQERYDIVLNKCFQISHAAAKYSDNPEIFYSNGKPVTLLRSTLRIFDTRVGRQDLMQTLLCVANETHSYWREYTNPSESVKEMKNDKAALEKCGFDPVLMGTKQLPASSNDIGGNGRLNLESYSN